MSLKPRLSARQAQKLSLTSDVIQNMAILQTATADMITQIQHAADENPFLTLTLPKPNHQHAGFGGNTTDLANAGTLSLNLRQQIMAMPLPGRIGRIAAVLAGDLDENGYLSSTAQDLAQLLDVGVSEADAAISALQSCEPVGIGARNLSECLYLQLVAKGVAPETATFAAHNLKLFADAKWKAIQTQTGLSPDQIDSLTTTLSKLSPRPGSDWDAPTQYVIPELVVTQSPDGGFTVSVNNDGLPDVHLDQDLIAQFKKHTANATAKLEQAKTFVQALQFRTNTLVKVASTIIAKQQAYFDQGPDHLLPLNRADLAELCALHPSTVGRAIAGKALLFNGRTILISQLLSTALTTQDGAVISALQVQRKIQRMISGENPDKPLSDDQISAILMREGVDIARRTVAKYRGCMNIPSSFERKRLDQIRRTRRVSPRAGNPKRR